MSISRNGKMVGIDITSGQLGTEHHYNYTSWGFFKVMDHGCLSRFKYTSNRGLCIFQTLFILLFLIIYWFIVKAGNGFNEEIWVKISCVFLVILFEDAQNDECWQEVCF